MTEEVVSFTASPVPVDLKRKHEDLELKAKRLRSEDQPDVDDDDYQEEKFETNVNGEADKLEKLDETLNDEADKPAADSTTDQSEDSQQKVDKTLEKVNDVLPPLDDHQQEGIQQIPEDNLLQGNAEVQQYVESQQATKPFPEENFHKEELTSHIDQQPIQMNQTTSRKIEIPNNKVGVVIGKAGDTINFLQINSGAKIHITKDFAADPNSPTRPVEITGTLESIIKAQKLIKDVIAESDAGGSPALVARGFCTAQAATGEHFEIQVPNGKAGMIIGKGGETIRNLQIRSGARVQLIQEASDGEQSKEKTVRVTGNKRQIEIAREMIEEVMAQPARTSSQYSNGYGSQGFRPRAPSGPSQWGSRGPLSGHDYPRIPYPSQNQYPSSQYGGYSVDQAAPPRSRFGPGWGGQLGRPSPVMQGPSPHSGGGGYEYYGSHGYGQSQVSDYGQPAPHTTHGGAPPPPPVLGYGQGGYSEAARYGGQHNSSYPQGGSYSGYSQDPYGKPLPSYGMQGQGPPSQSYGQGGPLTGQYSQPPYSYASGGGYSQQAPPSNAGGYHHHQQQGNGQPPVSGYVQPVFGYGNVGPTAAAASYGSGYAEPSVQSSAAAYGYQAPAEQSAGYSAGSAYGNYSQTTAPAHQAYDHQSAQQQQQQQ